ncbi:MAG: hypothetical protein WBA12_04425 [Catalinimonas sp.]
MCYDVRENYWRNVVELDAWPRGVRGALGQAVRRVERTVAPYVDHFLLAERAYAEELDFLGARYTIIRNKYRPKQTFGEKGGAPWPDCRTNHRLHLLYSGTIAEPYGIFDAVRFATALHALDDTTRLRIVGYCARTATLRRLRAEIADKPFVTLVGGEHLVPHDVIEEEIRRAGLGLMPYHRSPAVDSREFVKLFEYLAHRLPVIMTPNPYWEELAKPYGGILFAKINSLEISKEYAEELISKRFYERVSEWDLARLIWQESECAVLLGVVGELLPPSSRPT